MAERALSPEQETALTALWDERALARVATVTPSGDPHVVPIWWELRDGRVRIVTTKDSRKLRNLEASPRIAVTIDVDSMPYHGVRLSGTARLHQEGMADSIRRMSVHFWGGERGGAFARGWLADAERTSIVVEVVPDSVVVFREEG
jgi:PPOX class probable F420-dependent enzyme